MLYRKNKKTGDVVSALGFGAMRLPLLESGQIDEPQATRMLHFSLDSGVNYIDTAYVYHNEQSESFLGRALGPRRKDVFLATKLPHMRVRTYADLETLFATHLERLQTSYIDYYLIHNVMEFGVWQRLKEIGIERFVAEKKRIGAIRRIGFSAHMSTANFKMMLDDYDWDFAQVQYNYVDEDMQAGAEGVAYAHQKGLPLIVMEPIRGGLLAAPGDTVADIMRRSPVRHSPAEWALRWLWDQDVFLTVLSGMSSLQQVEENVASACLSPPGCMSEAEHRVINEVKSVFKSQIKVPCTGCGYCVPCPQGVRIPTIFECYNQYFMLGPERARFWYMITTSGVYIQEGKASACVECGLCETKCPQKIPIMQTLKDAATLLETDDFIERHRQIKEFNRRKL